MGLFSKKQTKYRIDFECFNIEGKQIIDAIFIKSEKFPKIEAATKAAKTKTSKYHNHRVICIHELPKAFPFFG